MSAIQKLKARALGFLENTVLPWLLILGLVVVLLLIVCGIPYLQFKAYCLRYPDAPAWTFVFQGGRR